MVNTVLYKLFNPDLKNLNNNQLIYHWNTKGKEENRLSCIEDFINKYPNFNLNFNKNTSYKDNLEEMANWHINNDSIKNNYISTSNYCIITNNDCISINNDCIITNNDCIITNNDCIITNNDCIITNNDNIDIIKNDNINYNFLLNKPFLAIYIYNYDEYYNNFYLKSLSKINYFNMNILVIIDKCKINKILFLKNINYMIYDKNKKYPKFDYLITNTYIEKFITNTISTVFLLDNINNINNIFSNKNIEIIDNIFDYDYLKDSIIISEHDCYKLYNNLLYKLNKSDFDKIYSKYKCNKIYVSNNYLYNNFLDIYTYKFLDIYYLVLDTIDFYFINLEKRKDRLKDTIQELENKNICQYTRFNALVPSKINKMLNPKKAWKKNYEYLKSALGCKMSHLEIMKLCIDSINPYLCILEDDVILTDDAINNLILALEQLNNINSDWDILYFSTNLKNKCDAVKIDNNLLEIKKGLTTTAQLFQTRKLKTIINIIENSELEIDNVYNEKLKYKYSVYPMIAYQRNSYSDINNEILDYGEFHRKFNYG